MLTLLLALQQLTFVTASAEVLLGELLPQLLFSIREIRSSQLLFVNPRPSPQAPTRSVVATLRIS